MCMNCGCGKPDDRHGNAANLTVDDLRQAGEANDQDLRTTARNILEAVDIVDGHGAGGAQRGTPATES